MSKKTIAQHKESLNNWKSYIADLESNIKRQTKSLENNKEGLKFYEEQKKLAEKKGMSEFDDERFNKKH
jgi:t-SNARE complex subunit (syntaxin)